MDTQEKVATEEQRGMLKLAIEKNWLDPNPFEGQYAKWRTLTETEADSILSGISSERLGMLEREMRTARADRSGQQFAQRMGRGMEDFVREIGKTIDGGGF